MTGQSARGTTPPYVPFPSFKTFVGELHDHGTPSRIDRSVLKRFSGITGTQLMTSSRFLKLIDAQNAPTAELTSLTEAYGGDAWRPALLKLLKTAYPVIFELDLKTATASHFDETFRKAFPGADSVIQKNIAFFLAAAKEAGVEISERVTTGRKARSTSTAPKKPRAQKAAQQKPQKEAESDGDDQGHERTDETNSFRDQLLAKFPPFDPTWPDTIKTEWFKGFDQFMQMSKK